MQGDAELALVPPTYSPVSSPKPSPRKAPRSLMSSVEEPQGGADEEDEEEARLVEVDDEGGEAHSSDLSRALALSSSGRTTHSRAQSPGSLAPCLSYEDVSLRVTVKGQEKKMALTRASGRLRSSRLTGLMGPSGSGKSTLLRALTGTTHFSRGSSLTGRVGASRDLGGEAPLVTLVQQEIALQPELTVRETMVFSAALTVEGDGGDADRRVDEVTASLNLTDVAGSRVGDDFGGISGGERRRLFIGVRLFARPHAILLDEPTSAVPRRASYERVPCLVVCGTRRRPR